MIIKVEIYAFAVRHLQRFIMFLFAFLPLTTHKVNKDKSVLHFFLLLGLKPVKFLVVANAAKPLGPRYSSLVWWKTPSARILAPTMSIE